ALFKPFRRAGAARTATRGAGLGLSIVRAVARAHGGEVTAQAIPEGGLDVRVALPTGG
ncbi:MAG: ATP-binding protein, partial [Actinomycetota bacterium]|nr:ATP-binding protein [Actinomycetota bacterium]